jgi:Holliday junction resolvasome RuvABC DNA-binding subunit
VKKKGLCFEIRGCPASMYLSCKALQQNLNCWEATEKPCCRRNDINRCKECEVYLEHLGYSKEEIEEIIASARTNRQKSTDLSIENKSKQEKIS